MKINSMLLNIFIFGFIICINSAALFAHIPISHILGVDELFKSEYKIHSPLTGLLHHQTTIPSLFEKFLSDSHAETKDGVENVRKLYFWLFTKTPSGEVAPSHLFNNPAANLSETTIGKLLVELEKLKRKNKQTPETTLLQKRIVDLIISDNGYQEHLGQAKKNIEAILAEFKEIENLEQEQKVRFEKAEFFRKQTLAPAVLEFKELRTKLRKLNQNSSPELTALENKKIKLESAYESMEVGAGTLAKKADLIKRLKHQIENNDTESENYQTKLQEFANILAANFLDENNFHATTTALLSYLWMKCDDKSSLGGYLETVSSAGFLKESEWERRGDNFYATYYNDAGYISLATQFGEARNKKKWVRHHFIDSIALSTDDSSMNYERALEHQHVPFSYTNWVTYNPLFADCTENAIYNIFLLIILNHKTDASGSYDAEILRELKEKHYPHLDQRVIDFFSTYSTFEQLNSGKAKRKWIDLLIGLNEGAPKQSKKAGVRYRRPKSELLSNYQNIIKVINRLFGYDDWSQDNMMEIFSRVKSISGSEIIYKKDIKANKLLERIEFTVGKTTFLLTCYSHMHCIFKRLRNPSDEIAKEITKILSKMGTKQNKNTDKAIRCRAAVDYLLFIQNSDKLD